MPTGDATSVPWQDGVLPHLLTGELGHGRAAGNYSCMSAPAREPSLSACHLCVLTNAQRSEAYAGREGAHAPALTPLPPPSVVSTGTEILIMSRPEGSLVKGAARGASEEINGRQGCKAVRFSSPLPERTPRPACVSSSRADRSRPRQMSRDVQRLTIASPLSRRVDCKGTRSAIHRRPKARAHERRAAGGGVRVACT